MYKLQLGLRGLFLALFVLRGKVRLRESPVRDPRRQVKFDLTTPCSECPFRADIRPFLSLARANEIVGQVVRGDKTFACHKTTGVADGRRVLVKNHQSCAGAMILVRREGWRNQMYQIAERLGLLDPRGLNMAAPVYSSAKNMIGAHRDA